jgi:hypothetical protein
MCECARAYSNENAAQDANCWPRLTEGAARCACCTMLPVDQDSVKAANCWPRCSEGCQPWLTGDEQGRICSLRDRLTANGRFRTWVKQTQAVGCDVIPQRSQPQASNRVALRQHCKLRTTDGERTFYNATARCWWEYRGDKSVLGNRSQHLRVCARVRVCVCACACVRVCVCGGGVGRGCCAPESMCHTRPTAADGVCVCV